MAVVFPDGIRFRFRYEDNGEEVERTITAASDHGPEYLKSDTPVAETLLAGGTIVRGPYENIEIRILAYEINQIRYEFTTKEQLRKHLKAAIPKPTRQPKAEVQLESASLEKFQRELLSVEHEVKYRPGEIVLDEADLRLALKWSSDDDLNRAIEDLNGDFRPDSVCTIIKGGENRRKQNSELARIISARVAEQVVMDYYQHLGLQTHDISITQIQPGGGTDWKRFDLQVDGDCIDVKNSRRVDNKRDYYTHHWVPRFKKSRNGQDVKIAGVFSGKYSTRVMLGCKKPSIDENVPSVFLGLTDLTAIETMISEFHERGVLTIDFRRSDRDVIQYFPPWVFDYPKRIYSGRDEHLAAVRLEASDVNATAASAGSRATPIWLAAGLFPPSLCNGAEWQKMFLDRTLNWVNQYGLHLPFVFLTVIWHFCQMLRLPLEDRQDYHPKTYHRLIYVITDRNCEHPLFIHDPLKTVHSLITALSTLWDHDKTAVTKYTSFKLVNAEILRGRASRQSRYETLLAYCGQCGYRPLIVGKHQMCTSCKHLICPECGFCSDPQLTGCMRQQ